MCHRVFRYLAGWAFGVVQTMLQSGILRLRDAMRGQYAFAIFLWAFVDNC